MNRGEQLTAGYKKHRCSLKIHVEKDVTLQRRY